jgi:hypothetical protein
LIPAVSHSRWVSSPLPLFPFGPLVAALIVASVSGGRRAIKDLLLRMLQWRAAPVWYAYAIFIPHS